MAASVRMTDVSKGKLWHVTVGLGLDHGGDAHKVDAGTADHLE